RRLRRAARAHRPRAQGTRHPPLVPAPAATTLAIALLVPLVAWRVYSRVRRMVGRQRLSKWRARVTLTIFPLACLMLGVGVLAHPERLAVFVAALGAGGALSVYGLRKTEFEAVPGMLYYTPNAHLGIALSLLFLGRVL